MQEPFLSCLSDWLQRLNQSDENKLWMQYQVKYKWKGIYFLKFVACGYIYIYIFILNL